MSDTPRDVLKDLVRAYGPDLLKFPNRVDSMLRSMCPDDDKEVRIIVFLASRGLPMELLSAPEPGPVQDKYMMMLTWQMGYNEATALWGIQAWAYALDIDLPEWRRPETAPVVVTKKPRDLAVVEPERRVQKSERISTPKARAVPDGEYIAKEGKRAPIVINGPVLNFSRDRIILLYSLCIAYILTFSLSQFLLKLNGALPYLFMILIATPLLAVGIVALYNKFVKARIAIADAPESIFNYTDMKVSAIAAVLLAIGILVTYTIIPIGFLFQVVSNVTIPLTGGAFFASVIVLSYLYTKNPYLIIILGFTLSIMDMLIKVVKDPTFIGFSISYTIAALVLFVAIRKLEQGKVGLVAIIALAAVFNISTILMERVFKLSSESFITGDFAIFLMITTVLCAVYPILWSLVLMAESTIRARLP